MYIGTKKWRQNLWLKTAQRYRDSYCLQQKETMEKNIPAALTEHDLQLIEGRGENMLLVYSKEGNITLDTVKFAE